MTDKWAEHKQKFCGCKDASRLNRCQGRNNCELPEGHPERVSAAPRQPEGEGLEVVAWSSEDRKTLVFEGERTQQQLVGLAQLCRLSDAQRAIAELREECERLRKLNETRGEVLIGALSETDSERDTPRQPEGEGLHQLAAEFDAAPDDAEWEPPHPIFQMAQERDTLRQQLAERDAEIDSLKERLSSRAAEHCDDLAEKIELEVQRDKLAGLLREAIPDVEFSIGEGYKESAALFERIDAALAEVKPCPESLHPAAT